MSLASLTLSLIPVSTREVGLLTHLAEVLTREIATQLLNANFLFMMSEKR